MSQKNLEESLALMRSGVSGMPLLPSEVMHVPLISEDGKSGKFTLTSKFWSDGSLETWLVINNDCSEINLKFVGLYAATEKATGT